MSRDWRLFLDDVIERAEKIGRLVKSHTFESFCADESDFDAVLMNLLVIGEATKNLPAEIREATPEVNWAGAAGLCNIIVHHYFGLDSEIIWDVATVHVPRLLEAAQHFIAQGIGEEANGRGIP